MLLESTSINKSIKRQLKNFVMSVAILIFFVGCSAKNAPLPVSEAIVKPICECPQVKQAQESYLLVGADAYLNAYETIQVCEEDGYLSFPDKKKLDSMMSPEVMLSAEGCVCYQYTPDEVSQMLLVKELFVHYMMDNLIECKNNMLIQQENQKNYSDRQKENNTI